MICTYTGQAHFCERVSTARQSSFSGADEQSAAFSRPHTSPAKHPAELRPHRLLLVMMFKAKMV